MNREWNVCDILDDVHVLNESRDRGRTALHRLHAPVGCILGENRNSFGSGRNLREKLLTILLLFHLPIFPSSDPSSGFSSFQSLLRSGIGEPFLRRLRDRFPDRGLSFRFRHLFRLPHFLDNFLLDLNCILLGNFCELLLHPFQLFLGLFVVLKELRSDHD